ncbi:MAG: 3-deoxy-D-manno-octulosonic acid transferase [Limisphaerales bacterium]
MFAFFFVLSSPYYFRRMWRRGNWRPGFRERFGHFDPNVKQALTNRQIIWMHAVSVGEVNLCTQLIRSLELRMPNIKFVVSTTTTTGMAELKKRLPYRITKIYYPIDRCKWVKRAFSVINPEAIVLVEAEIWPNFLWRARDLHIPVFLANARLSDRSYRGYRRFGFLFRPLFATFAGVGVQNEPDAARMRYIGCRPDAVKIVGNLKFDVGNLDERRQLDVPALFRQLGVPADAPILVGGSTHNGEEVILAEIVHKLRAQFPKLFLVLVPRHFERGMEVGRQLRARNVPFLYRSQIRRNSTFPAGNIECLLVDTTGELRFFYEYATMVFVGKSITAVGGQNPIEPGAMSKPMLFGPNMQNFGEIAQNFLSEKGAIQVRDAEALEKAVVQLLNDKNYREELGRNARRVVNQNMGAVDRTVEMIVENLRGREVFIAPLKK